MILKNKDAHLPLVKVRVDEISREIKDQEKTIEVISEKLKNFILHMDNSKDAIDFHIAIKEQRQEAEKRLEELQKELREQTLVTEKVRQRFENSTLPAFLEKVVNQIDKLEDAEKKAIISTIIARIEIDTNDKEKIKIFLNPSPPMVLTGGANVQVRNEWWDHKDLNLGPPGYEPGALTN